MKIKIIISSHSNYIFNKLKVDISLSEKLYRFRGKILRIEYDIPPNPIVTRL